MLRCQRDGRGRLCRVPPGGQGAGVTGAVAVTTPTPTGTPPQEAAIVLTRGPRRFARCVHTRLEAHNERIFSVLDLAIRLDAPRRVRERLSSNREKGVAHPFVGLFCSFELISAAGGRLFSTSALAVYLGIRRDAGRESIAWSLQGAVAAMLKGSHADACRLSWRARGRVWLLLRGL